MKQREFKLKYRIPKNFILFMTLLLTIEYAYSLYTTPFAIGPTPIKWFWQTYVVLKNSYKTDGKVT